MSNMRVFDLLKLVFLLIIIKKNIYNNDEKRTSQSIANAVATRVDITLIEMNLRNAQMLDDMETYRRQLTNQYRTIEMEMMQLVERKFYG